MRVLGIDPGTSPALALLTSPDVGSVVRKIRQTEDGLDEAALVATIKELAPDRVVIERVQAFPGQGASSGFNFGASWGLIRGIVCALGIPYTLVVPVVWKRKLLDPTQYNMGPVLTVARKTLSPEDKRAHDLVRRAAQKDAAIAYIREHYPAINLYIGKARTPDDNVAEAVCLAAYGLVTSA